MENKKIKIKILKPILFKNKNLMGKTISIDVDDNCIPLDKFWRYKFRDRLIDNCLKIIPSKKNNKNGDKKCQIETR